MTFQVFFTTAADADLDGIIDYIAEDNPLRAIEFVSELQERIYSLLREFPLSGNLYQGSRYQVFDNYVVVYDVDESAEEVYILLVTEGHRQWRVVLESR